mmetsp:Transcript_26610/g.31392  ORF Transcript_26610/g.31392 Transcript_26610/m.31392 type:complete len:119 (-) Transcript_26610:44-400(-)|eukprot:CAMPEP_0198260950 /NCGR_PEP_ID=MMETSP1447-20131203/9786_1 /TAXON_ID=420782 /ORGANISM="Chaetoceros dichaeta, Strain CCMP1751" /LENGTH=118 /DNA_ID=CAMNT_0043948717 /DNA_START=102 /DNA_END=458 /DNA_ORIENTATION=+
MRHLSLLLVVASNVSSAAAFAPNALASFPMSVRMSSPEQPDEAVDFTRSEEGGEYVEGGMGLAKDTANTYIIKGMEDMTPEEYRAELQKSVSARQSQRKEGGITGNQASNDYLGNLSN